MTAFDLYPPLPYPYKRNPRHLQGKTLGFISRLSATAFSKVANPSPQGESLWRRAFGTSKEDPSRAGRDGNNWAATASEDAATVRLIKALRSKAPGGWTDDRYEQSRHQLGAVHVAIDRTGRVLQQAEFQVFKRDKAHPDGRRPLTEDDPPEGGRWCKPYDLVKLLRRPNKQDSFGKMMYRINQQLNLTGMALTFMLPNSMEEAGQQPWPIELYQIPTAIAIPQAVTSPQYPEGYYRIQPLYPYGPFSSYPTPNSSVGAPIPAQWMLKMLFPHPLLRYEGYSPLTALKNEIDQLEAINRSRWYSMKRSFNPSAVLNMDETEMPGPLPEPELNRIHAEWEKFIGPENAGKLVVGLPGGKFELFGDRPVDMDYQSGWEQELSFILGGGFGITKPAAGMIEDSSYATLFATLKQLYMITLQPICDDIAHTFTILLAPFFGDDLEVEIRCKRIDDHDIAFMKVDKMVALKGMPESVIRLAFKQMDLPTDPEVIKDLSEVQEEQAAAPFGGGREATNVHPEDKEKKPPENPTKNESADAGMEGAADANERKIAASQPKPGPLGRGALGPRKALRPPALKSLSLVRSTDYKSLMSKLTKALSNGVHV